MEENKISVFRYLYSSQEELKDLLNSVTFMEFVTDVYNDLIKFYTLTNGLNGVVTAEDVNTALSFSGAIRHELTLMYELSKELYEDDREAFEDFKAEKEIEVRKRENVSNLAAAKWLSQNEIAKYAKMENFQEYKQLRKNVRESENKMRMILRMLENLKLKLEELKTISSNARTEMNNLNVDAYAMSLEQQALEDIKSKKLRNRRAKRMRNLDSE